MDAFFMTGRFLRCFVTGHKCGPTSSDSAYPDDNLIKQTLAES